MTPERLQQVSHLYRAALECDANARAAFLNEMCAGDAALRQEVEWLLAQGQSAERSLAAPRRRWWLSGWRRIQAVL
jgi:hypothetical protein